MYAGLLPVYVATLFLLHGLSPVPWLPFGFFIAAPVLILAAFDPIAQARGLRFRADDIGFALVYLLGFVPLLMRPSAIGMQNLLYAGQWLVIWVVAFWWVREWILISQLRFENISKAAAVGCVLLAIAVISEFILANTTGHYLSDFVPFSIGDFPAATVLDDAFLRPRGFASEAGFTAIAFECLLPLSIQWFRLRRIRLLALVLVVVPGYLLLFSAASIAFFLATLLVYVALTRGAAAAALIAVGAVGLLAGLAGAFDSVYWVFYEVILRKFAEFTPGAFATNSIGFSRPEAYSLAFRLLLERPFGIGWGGISQHFADLEPVLDVQLKGSGLISIPLEIGAAAGIIGMTCFVLLVVRKLSALGKVASQPARLTFFSLLWVSFHHMVVLELWFPMFWLSLALADCVRIQAGRQSERSALPSDQSTPSGRRRSERMQNLREGDSEWARSMLG